MADFRVLVTGSRDWDDLETVYKALYEAWTARPPGCVFTVVHGACPCGADQLAAQWLTAMNRSSKRDYPGLTLNEEGVYPVEETHPADWRTFGKAAGFRRNAEMVKLGADLCLAFVKDGSRGATHCAGLAEKAGIPVRRFDYWAISEEPVWPPGMGSV